VGEYQRRKRLTNIAYVRNPVECMEARARQQEDHEGSDPYHKGDRQTIGA